MILVWVAAVPAAIAIAGICYLAFALARTIAFGRSRWTGRVYSTVHNASADAPFAPVVTILKPLCGLDPELKENLRSFCDQDYPHFQVIFGVQAPDDPAIAVVKEVIAEFPTRDLALVVDPRVRAVNRKVANLMNMLERAKHDVLIIADADMRVDRTYLRSVVAPLADAHVGAVTALFGARPLAGIASALRAMQTNEHFMPSVLVRMALAKPTFGFGSTLVFTRQTVEAIGGLDALGTHLAEDSALTQRIAQRGLEIYIPPYIVHTIVADDARSLWDHEMRWMRTIRALAPAGFAGSIVTYPLPFALAYLMLGANIPLGVTLVTIAFAFRLLIQNAARTTLQLHEAPAPWLIPIRDCLSVAAWVASFFGRDIRWRGQELRLAHGDDLAARGR